MGLKNLVVLRTKQSGIANLGGIAKVLRKLAKETIEPCAEFPGWHPVLLKLEEEGTRMRLKLCLTICGEDELVEEFRSIRCKLRSKIMIDGERIDTALQSVEPALNKVRRFEIGMIEPDGQTIAFIYLHVGSKNIERAFFQCRDRQRKDRR